MTALVIVLGVAAVAILVWAEHCRRRDLRHLSVERRVVDVERSASAGGFGPEWDHLIAAEERRRAGERRG